MLSRTNIINGGDDEHLNDWYSDIVAKFHLSESTVKLVAKEIALPLLNESDENALDCDLEIEDVQRPRQLYCVCQTEYDEDRRYIGCICGVHYHIECVGLSNEEYERQLDLDEMTWKCELNDICK